MVEKSLRLVCEDDHGIEQYFPADDMFHPEFTDIRGLRRAAKKAGWRHAKQGGDYCDICTQRDIDDAREARRRD